MHPCLLWRFLSPLYLHIELHHNSYFYPISSCYIVSLCSFIIHSPIPQTPTPWCRKHATLSVEGRFFPLSSYPKSLQILPQPLLRDLTLKCYVAKITTHKCTAKTSITISRLIIEFRKESKVERKLCMCVKLNFIFLLCHYPAYHNYWHSKAWEKLIIN